MSVIFAGLLTMALIGWAIDSKRYRAMVESLRSQVKWTQIDRDKLFDEYTDLKERIVKKATPEIRTVLPKRYTGAQLRIMNDRLNAQASAELQERPNSEILKEQANG